MTPDDVPGPDIEGGAGSADLGHQRSRSALHGRAERFPRRGRRIPGAQQRRGPLGNQKYEPVAPDDRVVAGAGRRTHPDRGLRQPAPQLYVHRQGVGGRAGAAGQLRCPRAGRDHDRAPADLELPAGLEIGRDHTAHPASVTDQALHPTVVGHRGAAAGRRARDRESEPLGMRKARVVPERAPAGRRKGREQPPAFVGRHEPPPRQPTVGTEPAIAVERAEVVQPEGRAHGHPALGAGAHRRDQYRQRLDQARRHPQQRGALADPLPHPGQVAAGEIAEPAVYDSETVGRGGRAEVVALEQRDAETAQRRIPRDPHTLNLAPDHDDVRAVARRKAQPTTTRLSAARSRA